LRFLLDEMYPPAVAEALRVRGHDAVGVVERAELRSMSDSDVFATAQRERRAVVTENVPDFVPIANDHDARGASHYGLVLVHPGNYPRGNRRTIGAMVTALDALASRHPDDDPTGLREWL
jgi:predicted nuclease of predicted toxin-antitoxin system